MPIQSNALVKNLSILSPNVFFFMILFLFWKEDQTILFNLLTLFVQLFLLLHRDR